MTKKTAAGILLFSGSVMILGSVMVEVNMSATSGLGARVWFLGTAALGAATLLWAFALIHRKQV